MRENAIRSARQHHVGLAGAQRVGRVRQRVVARGAGGGNHDDWVRRSRIPRRRARRSRAQGYCSMNSRPIASRVPAISVSSNCSIIDGSPEVVPIETPMLVGIERLRIDRRVSQRHARRGDRQLRGPSHADRPQPLDQAARIEIPDFAANVDVIAFECRTIRPVRCRRHRQAARARTRRRRSRPTSPHPRPVTTTRGRGSMGELV